MCPQGSPAPDICVRGTYQDDVGQATCDPCPLGKYCDPHELANLTGIIYPEDCPMGYNCPLATEFAQQNPCEPGTFGNVTQLTAQGIEYLTSSSKSIRVKRLINYTKISCTFPFVYS